VHAGAREGESYVPSAVIDFPAKLPPRERLQTEVAEFPASAAQNAENPDLRPGERLTDFAWTLNADLHGVELRLIRLRDALVEFRRPQPRAELISEPDVIAVAEAIVCEAQDRVDFAEPTAVVNTGPAAPSDVRGEPVSRLAQLLAKRSPRAAEIFVQSRRARSLFVVRPRSPAEARAAWVQKSRAP
jgi:hypothetical protein